MAMPTTTIVFASIVFHNPQYAFPRSITTNRSQLFDDDVDLRLILRNVLRRKKSIIFELSEQKGSESKNSNSKLKIFYIQPINSERTLHFKLNLLIISTPINV